MPHAAEAIRRATDRLIETGLAAPEELVGCTEAEVAAVRVHAGGSLPASYSAFLAAMGRSAGRLLEGSDFSYPELLGLRRELEILLEETGAAWRPGPSDFVFVGHQGYEFLLLECATGDDPPVRLFVEGDAAPRPVFPRFTEWLDRCVADEADAHDLR